MKVFSPFLNGTTTTSGSFNVPNHPSTGSIPNPLTGSLFHDDTDGILKIYTGTQWQVVGEQALPVVGPASADIEYLLVAGGGAGGNTYSWSVDGGGGGGAGGLLSSSLSSVQSGSSFTVTVGAGGSQATNAQGGAGVDSSIAGATISTITATGGGGGGGYSTSTGGNGGSGGGSTNAAAAGSGTVGQGNDGYGGIGNANGGGGATQAGGVDQSPNGGQGGSGSLSYITGTATGYAGGGSGGSDSSTSTYTAGGYGGGGRGAAPGAALIGGNGTANTGGGGGGGSANDSYSNGGAGGSGVAILAYPTASISATGGERTFFNDRVAHTFNSSGTFSVGGIKTYTHNTLDIFGDSSCIALYNLDGNANDKSGNYNGTASNVTYAQSYINEGGVFNGSSSYITTNLVVNSTTGTAYSAWVKTSSTTFCAVGANGNSETNRAYYGVRNSNFWIGAGDTQKYTVSAASILDDNWHHIIISFGSSTASYYVDGILVDSTSYTGQGQLDISPSIGSLNTGAGFLNGYMLGGKIDQVRIFNKALSTSEVATLYAE